MSEILKFRLLKEASDGYSPHKVGYETTDEYPNLYDERTGELGICGGHGIYAWVQKEDYEIINQNKNE